MKRKLLLAFILSAVSFIIYTIPCEATSTIKVLRGTALTFKDSGGDYALTLNALGDNEARISAQADLGTGATADMYEVRVVVEWDAAPSVRETCDIYIATSDGTDPDGQGGVADAAFALANLDNVNRVGSVVAHTAAADQQFTASFVTRISTRYFSVIVHNNAQTAADNLQNTANTSWVIVTPISYQAQDT